MNNKKELLRLTVYRDGNANDDLVLVKRGKQRPAFNNNFCLYYDWNSLIVLLFYCIISAKLDKQTNAIVIRVVYKLTHGIQD